MFLLLLFVLAFVPMIAEAVRSRRHERTLRAGGAVEPPGDVYPAMRLAYPAAFAAMIAEAWIRGRALTPLAASGLVLFGAAKALKYWAVATLGDRWTFRVLVPPGSGRIRRGPYRVMRHPNYLAVLAELSGMALAAQAPLSGIASVVVFGALIRARIRVEERALGLLGPANTPPGDGTSRRWGR